MLLAAENLSKRYLRKSAQSNFFYAVQELSLSLGEGSFTALTGRSGSGKTTLLCMLSGLMKPDEGSVTLDGKDLYALCDRELSLFRNRAIAFIPQKANLVPSLNVLENILLPASLYKGTADAKRAQELMEALDIAPLKSARPFELSSGETRRAAIARALLAKPAILLADEPTGDLDDENTKTVLTLLAQAAGDGAAVLMVTHDPLASAAAQRRLVMNAGRLTGEE
ncbi:MAG: ATP-binding cassette domain-containing protein [Clostridia bacterium]|nr:ATP-binding cassette domain-containing protein [Clostridia bacterium]